jgi:hypothetical protein
MGGGGHIGSALDVGGTGVVEDSIGYRIGDSIGSMVGDSIGRTRLHKLACIAMVSYMSGWPRVGHPAMEGAKMQFRRQGGTERCGVGCC